MLGSCDRVLGSRITRRTTETGSLGFFDCAGVLGRVQAKPPPAVLAKPRSLDTACARRLRRWGKPKQDAEAEREEIVMLRIYAVMLEVVRELRPMLEAIAKRDASLADQLRRSLQSVVLNTAEGMGSRGGNRRMRYSSALGSMREVVACIDVGAVFGYIDKPSPVVANRFAHVIGTLVKLTA